jgi:hypothetical protein
MQYDGNFVLYVTFDWRPKNAIWSSGTAEKGKSPRRVAIKNDGSYLVLYDGYNNILWSGQTRSGIAPFTLTMQQDGNLVLYDNIYKPIWETATG